MVVMVVGPHAVAVRERAVHAAQHARRGSGNARQPNDGRGCFTAPPSAGGLMAELPAGTVTFLFTDLEGSTRLWEQYPDAMKAASARHDALLREAIEAHHGSVVK